MERFKVIYIHGFGSNRTSSKFVALHRNLPDNFDVDIIEVNHCNAKSALEKMKIVIEEAIKGEDEVILVGHSLGGFYAYHLAGIYGLKCVIAQPCMFPLESQVILNSLDAEALGVLKTLQEDIHRCPLCAVICEMGDEVIDMNKIVDYFKGKAGIYAYPGGNHKMENPMLVVGRVFAIAYQVGDEGY